MSIAIVKSGKHEWKFHQYLISALDDLKKNNKNDWDFKILISGDGMTRTGKSTLASQVAQYLDPTFAEDWKNRMVFDYEKLIDSSRKIGKYKAIIYDEARQGLDSKKALHKQQQELLDFFSQSGALNQFAILVLPDYFELTKSLALNESIFLINCYARNGFQRGYFDFFNRKDKRYLYFKGKLFMDYKSQSPSFKGTFVDYLPFNKKEYEKLKQKTLEENRKKRQENQTSKRVENANMIIVKLFKYLVKTGKHPKDIAKIVGMGEEAVRLRIRQSKRRIN